MQLYESNSNQSIMLIVTKSSFNSNETSIFTILSKISKYNVDFIIPYFINFNCPS
jgi:hypothetical protein